MKTKNVMAAIVFMFAIGSAVASEYLIVDTAWTRKADVPAQSGNCEQRTSCSGGDQACMINIDHDGSALTPAVDVRLYKQDCVTALFRN